MKEMAYKPVKEKAVYFDLPGSGGLKIKGILRGKLTGPLAVMMHGRPGNGNELLQYLGARYLYERGISTLRLFMYDFESHTRDLVDCNLETHVKDFEAVVSELRKQKTRPLWAIGHSYGGLTILKSKAKLDGAVLWDPTHGLCWAEDRNALFAEEFPEVTVDKYVIGITGMGWMYPAASWAYDQRMGDTSHLAAKDYPLKIISGGQSILADLGKKYYTAAHQPKGYVNIKGAGHGFDDSDDIMLTLFEETCSWLVHSAPENILRA